MPNIMEISGLLSGRMGRLNGRLGKVAAAGRPGLMDLRNALGKGKVMKRRKKAVAKKVGPRAVRALPGPNAERALEVAEKMLAEGKKPLAIAWARQAEKKGQAEGKSAIVRRAQEIVKFVRGEAALKMMAGFGDIDGVVLGRMMGLW